MEFAVSFEPLCEWRRPTVAAHGYAFLTKVIPRGPRSLFMKRLIILSAVLVAAFQPAMARHYENTFHDTLRPGGHQRSLTEAYAASTSCYASTGTSTFDEPTQAFKDCMSTHGFSLMSTVLKHDYRRVTKRVAGQQLPPGHFLSPYTGAVCHNTGWATICDGGSAFGNWH
jgi:hypothetical protein